MTSANVSALHCATASLSKSVCVAFSYRAAALGLAAFVIMVFLRLISTIFVLFFMIPALRGLEMEKFRPIKADIVLAIDTAMGDFGRTPAMLDVEVITHFLRKVAMAFPLSNEDSRIAIVEFAAAARIRLSLSEGIDQKALDAVYEDVSEFYDDEGIYRMGAVNYSAMFRRIYDDVFVAAEGDRPDVPNLVIVLTVVPPYKQEDPYRWRMRARSVVRGATYNFPEPDGVIVTTNYATQRHTHLPKFTLARGSGTIDPDAWYYQDFNEILHYAVIHLRHALRYAWVNSFYTVTQVQQIRTFDYTACRADTAFILKMPLAENVSVPSSYASFAADIVFAIQIDRSAPTVHHECLRTLLLNMTRYLPVSHNLIHFSAVEFDQMGSFRILANSYDGVAGCCMNKTTLFHTMVEKWIPQVSPRYRTLLYEILEESARVVGILPSQAVNFQLLSKNLQLAFNQSGRVPQILIFTLLFPDVPTVRSMDAWYRHFLQLNAQNLKGAVDVLIITTGNSDTHKTFTMAISPLSPVGTLAMETSRFEDVRGLLYNFVVNSTMAAVARCHKCHYDAAGQCVMNLRRNWRNVSGIEFLDGRYCENVSGVSRCASNQACVEQCERRPWGKWTQCFPVSLMSKMDSRRRRRVAINASDTEKLFYVHCPQQKKHCVVKNLVLSMVSFNFILALVIG